MNYRKQTMSLAMIALMICSTTLVHAASISTFADGNADVTVELRNQGVWGDDLSAGISLPAGETVTSAGVIVETAMASHEDVQTIDSSVMTEIWDPTYNNGLTSYSANSDFTYAEETVALTSQGYNADFETSDMGWTPGQDVDMFNWERSTFDSGWPVQAGCAVGEYCWGTNFIDDDYTDDLGGIRFEYVLNSEAAFVHPGKATASFRSYHSLYYRAQGSTSFLYDDCAYVAVRNSTNGQNWNNAEYIPFDMQSTTGVAINQGVYQVGTSSNQVPSNQCSGSQGQGIAGPTSGDYVLGGQSNSTSNPSGWATIGLDLSDHAGRYVQLVFVMESNDHPSAPENFVMPGWYVDGVRIGDPMPANGWMRVSSFAPIQNPDPGHPDGYGLLSLDLESSSSTDFGVDILEPATGNIVMDRHGNAMTDLQGSLIELWDIDAGTYPLIDFRFNFGSGSARLNTAVLSGFHLGTRVGSSFNSLDGVYPLNAWPTGGSIMTPPNDDSAIIFSPMVVDTSMTPYHDSNRMSQIVQRIKPMVDDSCGGPAMMMVHSLNDAEGTTQVTNNAWHTFTEPTDSFAVQMNYTTQCTVEDVWVDVEFGYHATGISMDIGADGDVEWGMTDPAFGQFGRQTMFRSGLVDGVNQGDSTRTIAVDVSGVGEGAPFLLPADADIRYAHMSYDNNGIGSFNLSLVSGNQEVALGAMDSEERYTPEDGWGLTSIQDEIQSLMDNPLVPVAHTDRYGNDWFLFRLRATADSAQSGSTIEFRDLNVIYDWSRALSDDNHVARELNQGVALSAGSSSAFVPVRIDAESGGGLSLSSLSIETASGYDSTMSDTGLEGLYPNGEIIEIVSTHAVSAAGQSLAGASLLFETASDNVEVQYTISNDTFWEVLDEENRITMLASLVTDTTDGKQIHWRFRVNPTWDDTPSVRIYASALSDGNVNGLPAGVLLDPDVGNAVENDAGITSMTLFNQAMVEQTDLGNASSSNLITLDFDIRLEDIDIAPDPSAYTVVLEKRNQSNLTEEWLFVDATPGAIGGNYTWSPNIPATETGTEYFRLRMANYTHGDTICPPAVYSPDSTCAIRFALTMDPFSPHFVNMSVFSVQGDWRELTGDTWVPASHNQKFKLVAQDIPVAPATLTLNYWVEAEHDLNGDREAQAGEYQSIGLLRQTETDTSEYMIDSPCQCINDFANSGIDPPQMVSLWVSGTDIGGNAIDGGAPGLGYDLVTYIGMESRQAGIEGMSVEDVHGTEFTDFNKSMYAGNIYHLKIDAKDDNGWRDVELVRILMNPNVNDPAGRIEVFYSPQNDTAWTDSDHVEIIDDPNGTGIKPRMTTRDGNTLISPFVQRFTLDLPIRMKWSVNSAYVPGVMTPTVAISDLDENSGEAFISNQASQRWQYSSGIQLDTTTFGVEDTVGFITQGVGSSEGGFVYQGDMLLISGRYVFSDGINDLIFVTPEIPLQLQIDRLAAPPNGDKGYQNAPAETTIHDFENGTFNILLPAPTMTNEFTYSFQLLGLPQGAIDATPSIYKQFFVKVDGDAPEVVFRSWSLTSGNTGEAFSDGLLSSSQMGCLNAEVYITELQALDLASIQLNWMFFKTEVSGGLEYNWTEYISTFSEPWQSVPLSVDTGASPMRAQATCIDLWANHTLPEDLEGVKVKFWVSGHDTAGNGVTNGGAFGSAITDGEYGLRYEAADYEVLRADLNVERPMALTDFDLMIDIKNNGNQEGTPVIQLITTVNGESMPAVEHTCPESLAPGEEYRWRINMDRFPGPQPNVVWVIYDTEGEEMGQTGVYAVAKYSEPEAGMDMALIVGIIGVIVVLIGAIVTVVVVLNKGAAKDEDEFIDEDDFLPEGQAVAPMERRGPPATRPGESRGPPGASRGPPAAAAAAPVAKTPMQQALEEFDFWDEATIQGYFDQGWNLDQLRDWVRDNM